jgi:hypothetical protein
LPEIAVFCEGKTEKKCLEALRGHWRLPNVKLELVGQVGDPSAVVEKAKARRRPLRRNEDIELWVVFDRDEHHHWMDAIDRARTSELKLGISNPCFELWALLLHDDQNACIHRRDLQRKLRDVHTGYDHDENPYLDSETVFERMEDAHERAGDLLKRAFEDDDPYKNPTTRFHRLVRRLRDLS